MSLDRPRSSSPVPGLVGGVLAAVVLVLLVQFVLGALFALARVVVIGGVIAVAISLYLRAKRSR